MTDIAVLKLLYIINQRSGNNNTEWKDEIVDYFQNTNHQLDFYILDGKVDAQEIKKKINEFQPAHVIAVGGDGTIKLAAEHLVGKPIGLGIIPAGSANGLAKELNIPINLVKALDVIVKGMVKTIHITRVNDQNCIHLSDLGFNAFVVKKFETGARRGMWGYVKAAWKVLWQQPQMTVDLKIDDKPVHMQAAMIVIANATKYGTGALINPEGKL